MNEEQAGIKAERMMDKGKESRRKKGCSWNTDGCGKYTNESGDRRRVQTKRSVCSDSQKYLF